MTILRQIRGLEMKLVLFENLIHNDEILYDRDRLTAASISLIFPLLEGILSLYPSRIRFWNTEAVKSSPFERGRNGFAFEREAQVNDTVAAQDFLNYCALSFRLDVSRSACALWIQIYRQGGGIVAGRKNHGRMQ